MNLFSWTLFYAAAFIGHMSFWIGLFNRVHGTNLNNRIIRRSSYPLIALGIFCLPLILYQLGSQSSNDFKLAPEQILSLSGAWGIYTYSSFAVFLWTGTVWSFRCVSHFKRTGHLLAHRRTHFDFSPIAHSAHRSKTEKFFASIPGNQIYQCVVEEREIQLSGLASCFDGLTITHLTDFHFTGNICREYFEQVVDAANNLQSDLVVITGDFIDSKQCWGWITEVLGRLNAPRGIYYILGNHDQRIGREKDLRELLDNLKMVGVANRWVSVPIGHHNLHITGNELPWFGKMMSIDDRPESFQAGDCRILLSHSPDQWRWGREQGFDLTLAGHTHGGQIRIPGIGPIVSPSKHGVKYASGFFVEEDKVMVVSRGVSGEEPIRLFCPPELGRLILRVGASTSP